MESIATNDAAAVRAGGSRPLWEQTADFIRERIENGTYAPGARLPPERELCVALDISRVTLRKALASLVDRDTLSASHGRGWYVATADSQRPPTGEWPNSLESFTETAERMGLTADSVVIEQRVSPANFDEAEELSVAPGTPLLRLSRVRRLDGVPIAVDHTRLPAHLIADLAELDFSTGSLYATLDASGVEIIRAEATIEARDAAPETAAHLGIEVSRPVLVMRQLAYDARDRPLLTSVIEYSADRYRLRTMFTRTARPQRR